MKSKKTLNARKEKSNTSMKRKSRHSKLKRREHSETAKREEDSPRVNLRAAMKKKKMVFSTRPMLTLSHPEAVVNLREEDVAVKRRSISLMKTSQLCDDQ